MAGGWSLSRRGDFTRTHFAEGSCQNQDSPDWSCPVNELLNLENPQIGEIVILKILRKRLRVMRRQEEQVDGTGIECYNK